MGELSGWQQLLIGWPWFQGEGQYPLPAYSEFLPPPRLGRKPYSPVTLPNLDADDPYGWPISEYEEHLELRPGLAHIARQVIGALAKLGQGKRAHGIARGKLRDNPYWPATLGERAGDLPHERYVTLAPLALSRTQDDKGRVRWTLFGGSEQGPARGFWRGFFTAPGYPVPEEQGLGFFRHLLHAAYGEPEKRLADLHRAGFRILPGTANPPFAPEGDLPAWAEPLLLAKNERLRSVKYLLTFRPFESLPDHIVRAYLDGRLHLLPFPGSLLFWGVPVYQRLQLELPLATQIPLLHLIARHEAPQGIRVPQSGWLHEPQLGRPGADHVHGPVRNTFKRTHRWAKVLRHEDELALIDHEDRLAHVLFSTQPDDLGLYGKPMARNCQVWTHDGHRLLDGPRATASEVAAAAHAVAVGGLFGYRFQYPAMCLGRHELYWHRPLIGFLSPQTGRPEVLPDAPLGYLTAYDADRPDPATAVEVWPRLLRRPLHLAALHLSDHDQARHPHQATGNVRKLLETHQLLGEVPLLPSLARSLLTTAKAQTLDGWLEKLPERAGAAERGAALAVELRRLLAPAPPPLPEPLTFTHTARRAFEVAYWKTIATLAEGKYLTKNNADCVRDPVTRKHLVHHHRDLEILGDYLLAHYRKAVARAGLTGRALVGDLPFRWQTDFPYPWMGGWLNNQAGQVEERDLIVVIPGRDRSRAVVMADHYDTAYMADLYDPKYGGDGARVAAAGADDNHSATAAMMLGAPLFLALSKAGRLDCDVWLVHLTGEEFPADCLGARHLTRCLVEGTLRLRLPSGAWHDLSGTRVQGVYLMDMIAHNNDRDRDIFQISPGVGGASMWLALQAHLATEVWNAGTAVWNRKGPRKQAERCRRSPHGGAVPGMVRHLALHGEVRPPYDPRSTLYNTDGMIFSDAGVPVVLFMENYDINRSGYHDTQDTMANIDLDYGAALAAIVIESVARAATVPPG